ncbi:response regulator transcription factor [Segatella paludivivens]|uniref:response regulator transcription factor n=1 Tax=Segatella paludivivens TaxID=185294 RepID=UPI0003629FE1|nr:LuxR C-terminal-related transcriptional regulator [Segatella paludivivens]
MNTLEKEYCNLLEYQKFDETSIGEEIIKTNIDQISNSTFLKGCALSVFDVYRKKHVYESEYYKELFKETNSEYSEVKVHPDDYEALCKNSIATFKHLFSHNKNAKYNKVIREYRALVRGKYQRVIEQIMILAFDKVGNIWLCLSIVDIAPNQAPPYIVNSKIVNFKTGLVFSPLDEFYNKDIILSSRELDILKLISTGQLSNEISDKLHFSVNTVNIHRQSIFKKFNVDTSIEAIRYAENLGLIDYPL